MHFNPCIPDYTVDINRWKVAGTSLSPKGIDLYSKCPYSVLKAVLGLSSVLTGICQKPLAQSKSKIISTFQLI